jgi:hypothetical protein
MLCVVYQDKIYIVGGWTGGTNYLNSFFSYSLKPDYLALDTVEVPIDAAIDVLHTLVTFNNDTFNNIFYTVKISNEYKVYKNRTWRSVVKDDAGTFKYLNSEGDWVASNVNTASAAITEATKLSANQMTYNELIDLHSSEFTTLPTSLTISFQQVAIDSHITKVKAIGLDEQVIPVGRDIKWKITTEEDSELILHGMRLKWN